MNIDNTVRALSPEHLHEHTGWMRRLVAQLVRDASQVDDLIQDAWAAALTNPPPAELPLRAWLSGIVRRTVLARGHGDRRRTDRERERVADQIRERGDAAVSVAELSACADEQRFLLEAIGELPEAERAVILLRFYADLPPREIAAQLDVPVNTVRTRQARGIERLRERLDRRHDGDASAWAVALLPLAGGKLTRVASGGAASAVGSRWVLAAGLLAASGVSAWWFLREKPVPVLTQETSVAVALEQVLGPIEDRSAVEVDAPAPEEATRSAAPTLTFEGRAIDGRGQPIEGVRIERAFRPEPNTSYGVSRVEWAPSWKVTDERGCFATGAADGRASLYIRASHPDYLATDFVNELTVGERTDLPMVRIAETTLEVEVFDEGSGRRCAGFGVLVYQQLDAFAEGHARQSALNETASTTTGKLTLRKRFGVGRPVVVHLWKVAGRGFDVESRLLTIEADAIEGGVTRVRFDVDVDGAETSGAYPVARGSVVDGETGARIGGAVLTTSAVLDTGRADADGEPIRGERSVQSQLDGSYAIALPRGAVETTVRVSHPDYVPEEASVTSDPVAAGEIRLRSRGSLLGQVLDGDGVPIAEAPLLIHLPEWAGGTERGRQFRLSTDGEGRFEVPALLKGRVWVYVLNQPRDADENALYSDSFRMKDGETRDVVLRVKRPERVHVRGSVVAGNGELPVFLPYGDRGGWTMAKPSQGGFDAGGLERGTYLVALVPAEDAQGDSRLAFLPNVEVGGLGAQSLHFAFPTSVIRGRVEVPGDSLRVVAVPEGLTGVAKEFAESAKAARSFGAAVDPSTGEFELENVAHGSHRLVLWTTSPEGDRAIASRDIDVQGSRQIGVWRLGANGDGAGR